jgi:polyisoprenoid-binding protein YceI
MPVSDQCSRYAVLPAQSKLTFEANSSIHPVHGQGSELGGYVAAAWDADGSFASDPPPAMRVELRVERLRSGNAIQDREMWKLIDSRRFPLIAADLREVHSSGEPGRYRASGDITLAGRVRRYEGELSVKHDGDRVTVDGDLIVDIRDFGIQPPRFLMLKVEPKVKVSLHLVAQSATSP